MAEELTVSQQAEVTELYRNDNNFANRIENIQNRQGTIETARSLEDADQRSLGKLAIGAIDQLKDTGLARQKNEVNAALHFEANKDAYIETARQEAVAAGVDIDMHKAA